MVSCRDHERDLVKVTLVVQKVKKGVPFAAVEIRVGNVTYQDHRPDSLVVVPQVVENILGVFKLPDIPNHPKVHRIESLGGNMFIVGSRLKGSDLSGINAGDAGRIVGRGREPPAVLVPQTGFLRWNLAHNVGIGSVAVAGQIGFVVFKSLLARSGLQGAIAIVTSTAHLVFQVLLSKSGSQGTTSTSASTPTVH